jgi:cell wall-associated NlpC family hydrolase
MLVLGLPITSYADDALSTPATPTLMSHDDMVLAALSLIGSPYKFGGDSPDIGFDCSGLVKYVLGLTSTITLPRSSSEMYKSGGHSIALDELKTGDLIFFRIGGSKRINHVAVYIGEKRFVHAPSTGNLVRVDVLGDRYWQRYLVGARRVLPENDMSSATGQVAATQP